jgi:bacterial/archaeal transporter family-2 protein
MRSLFCGHRFNNMLTRLLFFLVVALGGAALTLQVAWNARLRLGTGSPVLTTLISLCVSLVLLVLIWASGIMGRGTLPAFNSVPKWAWFGGIFAVYYLMASLIAIPKIGAAAVFSLVIAGQIVAALILDTTGAFGVPQIALNGFRILGAALLIGGVILIQKR